MRFSWLLGVGVALLAAGASLQARADETAGTAEAAAALESAPDDASQAAPAEAGSADGAWDLEGQDPESPAAPDPAPEADAAGFAADPAGEDEPVARVEVADGAAPQPAAAPAPRALGPIGYDSKGRAGRVHVVVPRDTLWDISDAYLGSAWVWPSIWSDNREIENPHLIYPGDRIWITETEMRRVTPEEAAALLAGSPPARIDATDPVPEQAVAPIRSLHRVSSREAAGLVTPDELASSASIVDAVPERVLLSQGDRVYVGLGADATATGEQFTIFRTDERVFDPDTGRLLGYHVDVLGWLEVEKAHDETSLTKIERSHADIERGDRLIPREPLLLDIPILSSPAGVDGKISYFPASRTMTAHADYVYLNRGALDGLEVGSPLEVYRPSYFARETSRAENVRVPDRVVAHLLVVRAQPESSVAVVQHTETELQVGDRFRGATLGVAAATPRP